MPYKEVLGMADAKNYKELTIPKGGAQAFYDALTAMNDATCPSRTAKKKKPAPTAKKKPAPKKGK